MGRKRHKLCACDGRLHPGNVWCKEMARRQREGLKVKPRMNTRSDVMKAIEKERKRQEKLWGYDHDADNTQHHWISFIAVHAGRAVKRGKGKGGWTFSPEVFVKQMIKVAALALAAIEWCYNEYGNTLDGE